MLFNGRHGYFDVSNTPIADDFTGSIAFDIEIINPNTETDATLYFSIASADTGRTFYYGRT